MSSTMVSYNDYVAGWLDSSIHDFLELMPPKAVSTKYALISCLDSNLNPASLREKSPELKSIASKAQVLATGLLLPTERLLEAESWSQIFFGFDEVWFFPRNSIEPKPQSATLVGPARIDQAKLNRLSKWMSRNSCSLALGDGEGLNVIVKALGLVRYVVGHSLEQPHPNRHSLRLLQEASRRNTVASTTCKPTWGLDAWACRGRRRAAAIS